MKKLVCVCLSVLLCLLSAACKGEEDALQNKLFSCYLSEDPISLDPQVANDDAAKLVLESLFEGLVRLDENGLAKPGVAKRWEAKEENRVFYFYLREDAVFSDGTPLTADDFVFALERAIDPNTRSGQTEYLLCIQNARQILNGELPVDQLGVFAVDDHTLRFELEYSYEDFPVQTAQTVFFPCNRRFFEESKGKYGMEATYVLGNGAFTFRKRSGWLHKSYLRLIRNEAYHGEHAATPSGILFTVKKVTDPLKAMEENKADVILIEENQVGKAKELGLSVLEFSDITWGICFGTKSTVFSSKALREAFVCALSPEVLSQSLPQNKVLTQNIIPPQTGYLGQKYRDQAGDCTAIEADIVRAQAAMVQGLSELKKAKLPALTLLCPNDEASKKIANTLIAEWRSVLGCYVNLEFVLQSELEKRVQTGTHQLALLPLCAKEDGPLPFLRTLAGVTGFSERKAYQDLLPRLYSETVSAARECEQLFLEEFAFFPLYHQNRCYAVGSNVSNLIIHPFDGIIDFGQAGKRKID